MYTLAHWHVICMFVLLVPSPAGLLIDQQCTKAGKLLHPPVPDMFSVRFCTTMYKLLHRQFLFWPERFCFGLYRFGMQQFFWKYCPCLGYRGWFCSSPPFPRCWKSCIVCWSCLESFSAYVYGLCPVQLSSYISRWSRVAFLRPCSLRTGPEPVQKTFHLLIGF